MGGATATVRYSRDIICSNRRAAVESGGVGRWRAAVVSGGGESGGHHCHNDNYYWRIFEDKKWRVGAR